MIRLLNKKQTQFEESGSKNIAFWAKGDKVYEIDMKHINFIRDNTQLFNTTPEEMRDVYRKYGEKFGLEGKARAEIMHNALQQGWLRVRHYIIPKDIWIIEFDKFIRRKKNIHQFIDWALDRAGMTLNDDLSLQGTDDNFYANYSFMDGGIKKFYFDEKISGKHFFTNPKLIEAEEDPYIINAKRQVKEIEIDILDLQQSKVGRDKEQQKSIDLKIKDLKDRISQINDDMAQRTSDARGDSE